MNLPLSSQHHIHLGATVMTHSGIFIVKLEDEVKAVPWVDEIAGEGLREATLGRFCVQFVALGSEGVSKWSVKCAAEPGTHAVSGMGLAEAQSSHVTCVLSSPRRSLSLQPRPSVTPRHLLLHQARHLHQQDLVRPQDWCQLLPPARQ